MIFKEGSAVQIIFCLNNANKTQLTKKRRKFDGDDIYTITLKCGKLQKTPFGEIIHDEIIGTKSGAKFVTVNGFEYYALFPTICEQTLSFPRGAAIIYPKDAAYILQFGDISKGQKILECGFGSGALTCNILRTLANTGKLISIEKREDFLKTGMKNVQSFADSSNGQISLENWETKLTTLDEFLDENLIDFDSNCAIDVCNNSSIDQLDAKILFDRVILDMLDPWNYINKIAQNMQLGGILIIYVTTIPQIMEVSKVFEQMVDNARAQNPSNSRHFINIECVENIRRPWKLDQLSIRPEHHGIMHSGFIITARLVTN